MGRQGSAGGQSWNLADFAVASLGLESGELNPRWIEWLMGFPAGWTESGASATPSFRRSASMPAASFAEKQRQQEEGDMASTEVELYEEQPPARVLEELRTSNSHARDIVDGWAPILIKIDELANTIADVQVMPKGLQGNPAAILVNVLAGRSSAWARSPRLSTCRTWTARCRSPRSGSGPRCSLKGTSTASPS